jgi:hypothetical protein
VLPSSEALPPIQTFRLYTDLAAVDDNVGKRSDDVVGEKGVRVPFFSYLP